MSTTDTTGIGVTVSAAELADALKAISPFTIHPDEGLTAMECVRLETRLDEGAVRLWVSASDRYTAAYARITAAGTILPTLVHRSWIRIVAKNLRTIARHRPASVAHVRVVPRLTEGSVLEISVDDGWFLLRVPTHDGLDYFPKLHKIFEHVVGAPSGVDKPIGLDLHRIEAFTRAAKIYSGSTVQWHFAGLGKPVRIQIGDTFTGLVMLTKLEDAPALISVPGASAYIVQAGA